MSQGFFQIHFLLRWRLDRLKWWHTILVVPSAIILVALIILVTSTTLALILILIMVPILICITSIPSLLLLIILIHILCLLYCHLSRLTIHSIVLPPQDSQISHGLFRITFTIPCFFYSYSCLVNCATWFTKLLRTSVSAPAKGFLSADLS